MTGNRTRLTALIGAVAALGLLAASALAPR